MTKGFKWKKLANSRLRLYNFNIMFAQLSAAANHRSGGENISNFKEKTEMKYAFVNGVILDGTRDMEPQSGKI